MTTAVMQAPLESPLLRAMCIHTFSACTHTAHTTHTQGLHS
jgi:hypothetical protein